MRIKRSLILGLSALATSLALFGAGFGALCVVGAYHFFAPTQPDVSNIREVKLRIPLRVYSADGDLMAEFGEERRIPVSYQQIPEKVVQAFIAAEDDRFFEHPGVDYQGILRAVYVMARQGGRSQGGSTITMQLARNVFLTKEQTWERKIREIFLALFIERELNKEEVLALYLNKIFFGQRAYGIAAAAEVYYGKTLDELTVAEIATLAGLPKAPSNLNPVSNPEAAKNRRSYVLRRMLELDFIDEQTYTSGKEEPIKTVIHGPQVDIDGAYVAEMARRDAYERFGASAFSDGYKFYTTVRSDLQQAAVKSLRHGLVNYDRRNAFRGIRGNVDLDISKLAEEGYLTKLLKTYGNPGNLTPAVVASTDEEATTFLTPDNQRVILTVEELAWVKQKLKVGNVLLLESTADGWLPAQVPEIQGAIVSLDPKTGAILALSGGFDFFASKFNRATQAQRQPGSAFKPFVYSAALANGFTPASVILDAPVVIADDTLETTWRPGNSDNDFLGPMRLREALIRSRNLVSIRLLREVTPATVVEFASRFGFDESTLPKDLSLALGSLSVTPLDLAQGYAVFANGGFAVEPYLIKRIENARGKGVYQATPLCVDCEEESTVVQDQYVLAESSSRLAPRVVDEETIFLINDIMREVIQRGTGRRARELGRQYIYGKTGTTNDNRDTWFSGFSSDIVTTTWVGFDDLTPLGRSEFGASTALPIWMDYMRYALEDLPDEPFEQPDGVVTVNIMPDTGYLASAFDPEAIEEMIPVTMLDQIPEDPRLNPDGSLSEDEPPSEPLF